MKGINSSDDSSRICQYKGNGNANALKRGALSLLVVVVVTCCGADTKLAGNEQANTGLVDGLIRYLPERASGWLVEERVWRSHRVLQVSGGWAFAPSPDVGLGHYQCVSVVWFLEGPAPLDLAAGDRTLDRVEILDIKDEQLVEGHHQVFATLYEPRLLIAATSRELVREACRGQVFNEARPAALRALPGLSLSRAFDMAVHWAGAGSSQLVLAMASDRGRRVRLWFREKPEQIDEWKGRVRIATKLRGRKIDLWAGGAALARGIWRDNAFLVEEAYEGDDDLGTHLRLASVFGIRMRL